MSDLLSAYEQSTGLAVVKVEAHCSIDTAEAKGNDACAFLPNYGVAVSLDSSNLYVTHTCLKCVQFHIAVLP